MELCKGRGRRIFEKERGNGDFGSSSESTACGAAEGMIIRAPHRKTTLHVQTTNVSCKSKASTAQRISLASLAGRTVGPMKVPFRRGGGGGGVQEGEKETSERGFDPSPTPTQ